MIMQSDPEYWFPAKRYGWGWGFPITWQGWVVLALFLGLIVGGALLFRVVAPQKALAAYLAYVGALSVLFVGVCWLKGEPPRWRWG
jgi:hypothetical protein